MMRFLYNIILHALIPYIFIRLYRKGRHLPAYRQRIAERFFLNKSKPFAADIWVHANSLGEVVAASPLIEALLAQQWQVLVTTMTPTGSQQVRTRFGERVAHQYVPYDLPWAVRRFFKQLNLRAGIIMETELWPNLIYYAQRADVPLVIANARLSDKSFKSCQKARFFFAPVLNKLACILAQSTLDAKRFIALGAKSERVHMAGNIKFDLQTAGFDRGVGETLKQRWGQQRPVFMVASTHEDEEQQLLSRLPFLQTSIPNIVVLIAPRHPERFMPVYELCKALGFNTGLRSQPLTVNDHNDVVVLDSLGELLGFYHVSDYAFVGGSLVPIGGHNVLEPIAMGVPVFCGPHMQNFRAICAELSTAQALVQIPNADALMAALVHLHEDPGRRKAQIYNATQVLDVNRGALALHCQYIDAILNHKIK